MAIKPFSPRISLVAPTKDTYIRYPSFLPSLSTSCSNHFCPSLPPVPSLPHCFLSFTSFSSFLNPRLFLPFPTSSRHPSPLASILTLSLSLSVPFQPATLFDPRPVSVHSLPQIYSSIPTFSRSCTSFSIPLTVLLGPTDSIRTFSFSLVSHLSSIQFPLRSTFHPVLLLPLSHSVSLSSLHGSIPVALTTNSFPFTLAAYCVSVQPAPSFIHSVGLLASPLDVVVASHGSVLRDGDAAR